MGKGFTQQVFEGSRIGEDKLAGALGGSVPVLNKITESVLGSIF